MNKVFVYPERNDVWRVEIGENPTFENAILLCEEGKYPAEVISQRLDINVSCDYMSFSCENQQQMQDTLNWIGEVGQNLLSVWDFHHSNVKDPQLQELFDRAYSRYAATVKAAADEMLKSFSEEDMEADTKTDEAKAFSFYHDDTLPF